MLQITKYSGHEFLNERALLAHQLFEINYTGYEGLLAAMEEGRGPGGGPDPARLDDALVLMARGARIAGSAIEALVAGQHGVLKEDIGKFLDNYLATNFGKVWETPMKDGNFDLDKMLPSSVTTVDKDRKTEALNNAKASRSNFAFQAGGSTPAGGGGNSGGGRGGGFQGYRGNGGGSAPAYVPTQSPPFKWGSSGFAGRGGGNQPPPPLGPPPRRGG